MTQDKNALVLEIFRQQEILKMGVYEQKELASTLRHYSQLPFPVAEINNLSQEIIFTLNRANKKGILDPGLVDNLRKTGQLLWDQLLAKPIKDRLRAAAIKDLVLSLDEELINIPWELLYDGKDFLCLKFNLGRVVRTKDQVNTCQYRGDSGMPVKMLILANPVNDLQSAYQEGLSIRNQFDRARNRIRIDFKSTHIDTLYVKKNLRDYDIIHFAGHCEYNAHQPEANGWVLSDGKFTTRDILTLSETASLPGLVFSNACQSAKEEIWLMDQDYQLKTYSLAAAFLFSGVRHYIGTIRKIEDPVSLKFAREFYARLIKGNSIGESLRLSRLKLISEYGMESIFWTSYLLYGDPNFVLFRPKKSALQKPKKITLPNKKQLRWACVTTVAICIIICLFLWLPSLNPNTYFLFAQSRKLFLSGKNSQTISIATRIIERDPLFLSAYPLLAKAYQRLGDKGNALKYYFDYARYSERRNDKKHLAFAYTEIGWIYHLQGEYIKAADFYNKAIALSRQNKDKLNEAIVLRKLAVWHIDRNDIDKALELLTKSSEINRERQYIREHKYNLACDYFDIGLVFTNKDDFITAKEFYRKSLSLFEKLKLKHELSDYYFNLGEIYLFEKQYQKALDSYLQGLKIDQAQGNKANLAGGYNMLGELYIEMDNLAEAEKSFKEAALISQEINAPLELASAAYNLGLFYKKNGQKNKAREYFRQAQEIYYPIDPASYQEIKEKLKELDN